MTDSAAIPPPFAAGGAELIDGRAMAAAIRGELRATVEKLSENGVRPGLAVALVGEDPASAVYVGGKIKACKEIGIRSIFNILGPMTNPARANVQLTGVFARELTTVLAEVLVRLGMKRTLVVWGEGNLDELTITGTSHVADGHDGKVTSYTLVPEDVGLARATLAEIRGGATAAEAAQQVRQVLGGAPGPKLNMVLLNAGAAFHAAGKCNDIKSGVVFAREIIHSGAALGKLEQLLGFCRSVGPS